MLSEAVSKLSGGQAFICHILPQQGVVASCRRCRALELYLTPAGGEPHEMPRDSRGIYGIMPCMCVQSTAMCSRRVDAVRL